MSFQLIVICVQVFTPSSYSHWYEHILFATTDKHPNTWLASLQSPNNFMERWLHSKVTKEDFKQKTSYLCLAYFLEYFSNVCSMGMLQYCWCYCWCNLHLTSSGSGFYSKMPHLLFLSLLFSTSVCGVSLIIFCFIGLFAMDISCTLLLLLLPHLPFQTFLGELSPCSCGHQKSPSGLSYLPAYHTAYKTSTRVWELIVGPNHQQHTSSKYG